MKKKLPIFMILLLFIVFSPVTVSNAKTLDKLPLKSGSYNWSKAKSYYVQYTTAKPTNQNATAINLPTKVKGYNGDFYIKIDKKFHMISKASSKTYTLPNNMKSAKIFYVPKGTKKCTAYFYVKRIRWAGHRGSDIDMYNARTSKPYCKLNRTPNSKASFDHAVQKGAFTIETDLYLTGNKNVDYVNGKLNPTLRHYYNDKFDPNYRFLQFQNTCRGKSYMMLDLTRIREEFSILKSRRD